MEYRNLLRRVHACQDALRPWSGVVYRSVTPRYATTGDLMTGEGSQRYGGRLETLGIEIYDLAGRQLNIGSPKQLQKVLFDELGLPVVKRTKTGPSTDAEVLEILAGQHPLSDRDKRMFQAAVRNKTGRWIMSIRFSME